jgi:hypothetical protein
VGHTDSVDASLEKRRDATGCGIYCASSSVATWRGVGKDAPGTNAMTDGSTQDATWFRRSIFGNSGTGHPTSRYSPAAISSSHAKA